MAIKKLPKSKQVKKNEIPKNHRSFLAVLVLFAGFSLYAITSFMTSNNNYIKKMFADVTSSDGQNAELSQVQRENPFSDLSDSHSNYQAILELYYKGVVSGYADNTFKADNKVNRAEFAKMLAEASDVDYAALPSDKMTNCFNDVSIPGAWFEPSVCAAKYKGWVNGYEGGDFGVTRNISKAEGLKILEKAFGFAVPSNEGVKEMPYNDVHPGDWFVGAAQAAKENGLVGKSTVFIPGWELTRADVAQVIYNAMKAKGLVNDIAKKG
ncbi:S-layer homology domain-containing protein [Candidatus Peregrinibacteria bacterium]|nr:S-layer homology domain-containing protein [Candidatus Peregrinibacteria bacterium]